MDLKEFPLASRLRGLEVVLQPGDLLYIPPLWWHHVTAIADVSLSVNVWSTSMQQRRHDDAVLAVLTDFHITATDRHFPCTVRRWLFVCVLQFIVFKDLCT
jgi:hypothetical protein